MMIFDINVYTYYTISLTLSWVQGHYTIFCHILVH